MPRLAKLVTLVARRFGGVQKLASAWVEQIRAAQELAPGSARLLRSFIAFGRLLVAAEHHASNQDLRSMTDEELNEIQVQGLLKLIAEHPEIAVAAGEQLGWQVIPPTSAVERLDSELVVK